MAGVPTCLIQQTTKPTSSCKLLITLHNAHLSKALTRPRSFLLFLQLMSTCELFFTDPVSTDRGPVLNSSCSRAANSSAVISPVGFWGALKIDRTKTDQQTLFWFWFNDQQDSLTNMFADIVVKNRINSLRQICTIIRAISLPLSHYNHCLNISLRSKY